MDDEAQAQLTREGVRSVRSVRGHGQETSSRTHRSLGVVPVSRPPRRLLRFEKLLASTLRFGPGTSPRVAPSIALRRHRPSSCRTFASRTLAFSFSSASRLLVLSTALLHSRRRSFFLLKLDMATVSSRLSEELGFAALARAHSPRDVALLITSRFIRMIGYVSLSFSCTSLLLGRELNSHPPDAGSAPSHRSSSCTSTSAASPIVRRASSSPSPSSATSCCPWACPGSPMESEGGGFSPWGARSWPAAGCVALLLPLFDADDPRLTHDAPLAVRLLPVEELHGTAPRGDVRGHLAVRPPPSLAQSIPAQS